MLCGILEGNDGSIWFGSEKEVYRYDRKTITDFKTMVIHIRQQFRVWSEQHWKVDAEQVTRRSFRGWSGNWYL